MVNTEDFIKRLEIILEYYSVSASVFADTIGVQRSGLSHLLSGRNKPSLDFIMKIVEKYPEVDLYWLLNGTGSFPKDNSVENTRPASTPAPSANKNPADLFSLTDDTEAEPLRDVQSTSTANIPEDSSVEQIVVFYKDGTFKKYKPRE